MDQGGGGGDGVTTVKSSTTTGPFLHRKRDQSSFMEFDGGTAATRFPGGVELIPVSLNSSCRDGGEKRKVVGEEVDFFSHDVQKGGASVRVKDEHSRRDGADAAAKLNLDVNTRLNLLTANTGSDQSTVDDGISPNSDDKKRKNELVALQMELERMNEENQRLRSMLTQVSSNYSSLQLHHMAMMQQQSGRNTVQSETHIRIPANKIEEQEQNEGGSSMVPRQFMDLGPAATTDTDEPSQSSSGGRVTRSDSPRNNKNQEALSKEYPSHKVVNCGSEINAQLDKPQQGRDGREGSSDRESPAWVANKLPKLSPSPTVEQSAEATMRKARVSVRARSEAPMITDGCQWRKYGQKMAKGNPCPRAYYRCTMAAGCPVRKQVQRCAEDRSILITTYEGNHSHPLPPAAMAMASTTSTAATMLLSGSMSSPDGLMNSNFLARTMLPCSSSMATISASAPFPTVTLDLTQTPSPLQFQRPPTQFSLPFPGGQSPALTSSPAASLGQIFGQSLYNQSKFSGLQLSPNIDTAQFNMHNQLQAPAQHPSLVDTVSAATAAITADPNFTAALAAAITSIIGGGGVNQSAGYSSPAAENNNSNNNNNSNSITSK